MKFRSQKLWCRSALDFFGCWWPWCWACQRSVIKNGSVLKNTRENVWLPARTTFCKVFSMEERVDGWRGRALLPCQNYKPAGKRKVIVVEQLVFLHAATCLSAVRCFEVGEIIAQRGTRAEEERKGSLTLIVSVWNCCCMQACHWRQFLFWPRWLCIGWHFTVCLLAPQARCKVETGLTGCNEVEVWFACIIH